jgi:hypothetical protein
MFKPDVSPGGRPIRLWQHGTSLSFSPKIFHSVKNFW